MEMHEVRYFLSVAKHLSFTRAAQELSISQPSLTRAIQKLEKELLGPLFRRERMNTHLTELGRMMLPHLQATDAASEAARAQARRFRAMKSGSVALGVCTGLQAGSIMERAVATVRQLSGLEFSVEVAVAEILEARLMAGELDAAMLPVIAEVNERFNLNLVREDDIVLAIPGGHRFAAMERVALEDLDGEQLIIRSACLCSKALLGAMVSANLRVNTRHRSNDPIWVAELVRSGLGCAALPRVLAEESKLEHRPLSGVPPRVSTALVTVSGRRWSPALSILIDRVSEGHRQGLSRSRPQPGLRFSAGAHVAL